MNKIFKIYKISFPSGKVYIGQTYNIHKRWLEHLWEAFGGKNDTKVYRAMRKYNTSLEDFSIIEDNILTQEEANAKEIFYIEKYNSCKNGYNTTTGGKNGFQPKGETHPNAKLTDEEVAMIRKIRATKKYTFPEVYKLYSDKIAVGGFQKIWDYNVRKDVCPELDTDELRKFYKTDKRTMLGSKHFLSKLTEDQVYECRKRYFQQGEKMKQIWNDFKDLYSLSGFRKIVLGKTYTNVPMPQRTELCKKKKEWLTKEEVIFIRQKYKEGFKVMDIIKNWFPDRLESTISLTVSGKRYKDY